MPEMTDRQKAAWPRIIGRLNRAIGQDDAISKRTDSYGWTLEWAEELRPGRGHDLNAVYCDGEYFAQVRLDVYGNASDSVAELTWIHTPAEECGCSVCEAERAEEVTDA